MAFPFGEIGPANCYFGGTTLGENHSVTVNAEDTVADHKTAQYGSDAKDQIYTGHPTTVEVKMTESTAATLALVAANATQTGNEVIFASAVGTSLRSIADYLEIRPFDAGAVSADATKFLRFFVAAPKFKAGMVFDAESDREVTVEFTIFRATEVPSGETYSIGDIWAIGYGETS